MPSTPQISSSPQSGGENMEAGVWLNLPAVGEIPLLPGGDGGEDSPHFSSACEMLRAVFPFKFTSPQASLFPFAL